MNPTSNADDQMNPAEWRAPDRDGRTGRQDDRQNSEGRRHANWVGRYQLEPSQVARIYSGSILLIIGAILAGLVLSFVAFLLTPPSYRATGTILVDELPFVLTGKTPDAETERQLVQTLILSIADREMRLMVEKQLELPPGRIAFAGLDKRLHLAGQELRANVQVAAVRSSRLGSIIADSQSPEFAALVVNAILDQLNLYNQIGGRLKAIQTTAALSKSQAENTVLQLADVSAQRIKLEQENEQLENYLKRGLTLANYPAFALDGTLGNLKTQLFLVESEYKALAATSTRGQRLEGKASELKSLRNQINIYANKLAESLHFEYAIRLSQEKGLQESKQKAAEKLDDYAQESTRIAQSFGNPEQMRLIASQGIGKGVGGGDANMVVVVNHASPPVRPYAPLLVIYLLLGGMLGGLVGLGLAALTSLADNNLVSSDQIETRLGLPCLAVLSERHSAGRGMERSEERVQSVDERNYSSALNVLRDHLFALLGQSDGKIIGFSSVSSTQRCSELVADLAQVMVEAGKRTLVVDLHFEAPLIAKTLGVPLKGAIKPWFHSRDPIAGYLSYSSNQPDLALFSAFSNDLNLGNSLVRRPLDAELTSLLGKEWDLILIDAPCIIPDPILMLALPLYSPMILTADFRRTKMSALTHAISRAREHQWRVAGIVITKAPAIQSLINGAFYQTCARRGGDSVARER